MNKKDLISKISNLSGLTLKVSEQALNAFIDAVTDALANGNKITISGFGVFDVTERAARTGRNPATGETILIPSSKSLKFKASKILKDAVKGDLTKQIDFLSGCR